MAEEYIKVLKFIGVDFNVVSKSSERIEYLKYFYNIDAHCADIQDFKYLSPNFAINCVDVANLFDVNLFLLKRGVKHILSEKPAAFEIAEVKELSSFKESNFILALNRRFYRSSIEAQKILLEDGGSRTCSFQFNERTLDWTHPYSTSGCIENMKPLHSQSIHLIDLAFHLIGFPHEYSVLTKGTNFRDFFFSGSGTTESGCLFSFSSDWASPGSWAIDITSKNYRLKLEPLEELSIYKYEQADKFNKSGGFTKHRISSNKPDLADERSEISGLKSGLLMQTEMFLNEVFSKHGSLSEFAKVLKFINSFSI
jgi:predicted dehydrogenase